MEGDVQAMRNAEAGERLAEEMPRQKARKRYTLQDIALASEQAQQLGLNLQEALEGLGRIKAEDVAIESDDESDNPEHAQPEQRTQTQNGSSAEVLRQPQGAATVLGPQRAADGGGERQQTTTRRIEILPSMLAGGSITLNPAPRQQPGQAGEISALQRRMARIERQVELISENSCKGSIRAMANCPPAAFHSNIKTLVNMVDKHEKRKSWWTGRNI